MPEFGNIIFQLEQRRRGLGLSQAAVAHRAGLGVRTVQRVLSGQEKSISLSTISAIAKSLEAHIKIDLEGPDINDVLKHKAEIKAARLASMVQGTSGLEAQAVSPGTLEIMKQQIVRELLSGSTRHIWAEE